MFDISQLVVIGAVLVPFWLCVVMPLALTILIFISIGKGIAYLFRRDLYDHIDDLHESIYQRDQKISNMRILETRLTTLIDTLDQEIKNMNKAHELALAKVKFNAGNTGMFQNLPQSQSVVTELPPKANIQAPLQPSRRPPPPRPTRQLQS